MSVKYQLINLEEAVGKHREATHAAHIMLWTKDNCGDQEVIYALMQMRSDGRLGFPGGKSDEQTVDENEILSALYRELQEEIDFTPIQGQITLADRVSSHLSSSSSKKVLHFFAKELPLALFQKLEKNHMNARDFPKESLGLFRVPLRATGLPTYEPVRKFFHSFGKQNFAGNSRNQLIDSVIKLKLIGESDRNFFVKKMSL